jgi:Asp-tRNA(Asn)/Glu-tRNA(Gln) amidotransferase A subunit family amidase
MSSGDLPFLSAAATAQAIRSKQVSPVDVVQASLARIERLDRTLHAYITVLREEALSAARQAEQGLMRGESVGPLFGVPVAVKD